MDFIEELTWRGMIHDMMPGTAEQLKKEMTTAYLGIDPTADSLHIGHLVGVMMLKHFQRCGHKPIALVGGATGMIGDPSGKSLERNLLDEPTLRHNQAAIKAQLSKLIDFDSTAPNAAEMVNNYDWMKEQTFLGFIRDIGKLITVNYMMAKDSVKKRFNGEGEGMSFTEFTYQLVQGFDFLTLYETKNCKLQLGGSDQWGNITTGTELIRRKLGAEAYAITCPLITKADGTKFGKSESGTVWLDAKKTSPYEMYQFLVNSEDAKVIEYLKRFTFLDKEEIDRLEECVAQEPHLREAQKALAREVVTFLHGSAAYETALKITNALFKGNIRDLNADEQRDALNSMEKRSLQEPMDLASMLVTTKIASSKREAREWIKSGSIQINGERVKEETLMIDPSHVLVDDMILVKRGKRNYYVVSLTRETE